MCSQYLSEVDDGLIMRKSGLRAKEKLDYLKRYIDIFTTSMGGKPWCSINYIDLFAGPGKCRVEEPRVPEAVLLGSPLLALLARRPFDRMHFVELDPIAADALQHRIDASPIASRAQLLRADANSAVQQVLADIREVERVRVRGQWPSMNLAFLDPTAFELRWETVRALAAIDKMDLVMYYPQSALSRNLQQFAEAAGQTKADQYFGTGEWREVYKRCRAANVCPHRELMNLYKGELEKLGYCGTHVETWGTEPAMRQRRGGGTLYRLLFASKHPLGNEFWSQVMRRDAHGQLRMDLDN